MSEPLSNTSAAVLGLVALGARSGYEIRRAAELSLRFFWALGPPQIYSELTRLEEAGLVAGADDARGRRARRTYEVTRQGSLALRRWLNASGAGALELRDAELLRLFFADALGGDELRGRLATMRGRSQRALAFFESDVLPAAARTAERGFVRPETVARFGVELHEFLVGWCDRLEREIEAK
jgi:DNA-binding PadR family transcriptional regulator